MNVQVNRHAMTFGLYLGLLFCLNFFIATIPQIIFLQYIIAIIILFATYKFTVNCRENVKEGIMSYGSALAYILQLYLYGSMIVAMFKYLFLKFIRPNLLMEQLEQSMKVLSQTPMASIINDELYVEMKAIMTPLNIAVQSIWINLMYGLFVGLIMAAFIKKEKSIFED